ncbi:hypothetical protein SKAU_G00053640 [Synaphobranchus kaupii]|uniref:Uncharacterized protein n=1 Tax=Synaphobranchus kaupii TaxID=118154 RepID=A0A9Q1G4I7_SYNKA|nr:hypothetical protein SKAU_G00053640 [Synaphobranchus kaupii]
MINCVKAGLVHESPFLIECHRIPAVFIVRQEKSTSTTSQHRNRCPWSRSAVRSHKRTVVTDKQIRDL